MRELKLKKISDYGSRRASGAYEFSAAPHLGGNIRGGDKETYYPELWSWLVERFAVKRVLDVGCGDGINSAYFERLGCRLVGIEGLLPNALHPQAIFPIVINDFEHGFVQLAGVDLVWCCELLEHIREQALDNVMQTLLNGRLIAMTHAFPGQGGHHHVNEQPAEYWIDLFGDYGCTLLEQETAYSRTLAHSWYARSGMLFVNSRWTECNDRRVVEDLSGFAPSAVIERVLARAERQLRCWQAEGKRILIYGAGRHTDFLLKHTALGELRIVGLADQVAGKPLPQLGLESVAPQQIAGLDPDIILISSLEYQEEIYQQLTKLGIDASRLYRLYAADEIAAVKQDLYRYL
ncbi:MAG: methyltransferase domain-containing protein [Desulfuromonadaceae bacterium]|nr:methyltransferase domain-containing protein [Desulfuromonadaceae bacterium]